MTASIAESTAKQYNTALKYYWEFCRTRGLDPFSADDKTIITCITEKFKEGAAYGTLNAMRSAIALINVQDTTNSTLLHRYFKGIFRLRPSAPNYTSTWDVGIVLDRIELWGDSEELNMETLSRKCVTLLALGSAFRVQSIRLIKLQNIVKKDTGVEIRVDDLIKTSRPGAKQPSAFFPYFNNPRLCVARTLETYIDRTATLRGNKKQLIISHRPPYVELGNQSISRWIRDTLKDAGIDAQFTAHSTRHAFTSRARAHGLPIDIIKQAAGWSETSKVFSKFYNKPIVRTEDNFAAQVFSPHS